MYVYAHSLEECILHNPDFLPSFQTRKHCCFTFTLKMKLSNKSILVWWVWEVYWPSVFTPVQWSPIVFPQGPEFVKYSMQGLNPQTLKKHEFKKLTKQSSFTTFSNFIQSMTAFLEKNTQSKPPLYICHTMSSWKTEKEVFKTNTISLLMLLVNSIYIMEVQNNFQNKRGVVSEVTINL